MPVFVSCERFVKSKTKNSKRSSIFKDVKLAICLHISKETAVLVESLQSLGAEVTLVAANPLSTQNEIASFLASKGVSVYGSKGESTGEYERQIRRAAISGPDLIVDDGGELHVAYSKTDLNTCIGGTDETTSGTMRLAALDDQRKLRYPAIPVNEAQTKHIFDNRYGTGQSAVDGLIRATGLLIAGKVVVVAGYGWVGRGVAERIRGLGGRVVVTEVSPIPTLQACLDGFEVRRMQDIASSADIILTCTGQVDVVGTKIFKLLKDGAILGNVGHFDQEIKVSSLYRLAERRKQVREDVSEIQLNERGSRKNVYLLCDGRVVNLAAAEGHPPEVMQLSFANQLLSLYYLLSHAKELKKRSKKLLTFPAEIDEIVSRFALEGFNLQIDRLSTSQKKYARSFER